jgi:hypothetical protein
MKRLIQVAALVFCLNRIVSRADIGLFMHPMGLGNDTMVLPLPAGAEVCLGVFDHFGISVAYSKLQTDPLLVMSASLQNQKRYGEEISSSLQWHSRKEIYGGLIAEAGAHAITAKRVTCAETDMIGCLELGSEERHGFDFSMDAGYGGNWGWLRYYGLVGARLQSIRIRSVPIDARVGLGFSWPRYAD